MADKIGKSAEKIEDIAKKGGKKPEIAKHGGKEIEKAAKEFIEGVSEVVEGTEAAEFVEGEVAEKTGEGKSKAAAVGIKSGAAAKAVQKAAPPTIEIMRIQIATQVEKEIRILEKEAARLLNSRNFNPSKLNGVVAKIRELKDILANIAYATAETLKGWWMKFVNRVTI